MRVWPGADCLVELGGALVLDQTVDLGGISGLKGFIDVGKHRFPGLDLLDVLLCSAVGSGGQGADGVERRVDGVDRCLDGVHGGAVIAEQGHVPAADGRWS